MTEPIDEIRSALAGRYDIERELGRGGMATVYLARDIKHGREVAIKVVRPELGAVLGAERFLNEIKVTANLQHPNLLPLFDSGEANGLLFYVMPYVQGESLRARLERERQLPIEEAVDLAVTVAGALDYAHRAGVVHRDLKPENILLSERQPLIADFGIALAISNAGAGRITATGLSLGTPPYMSPEQAAGERAIDGRTDVYALAVVLYEMLAGEPPHTGPTAQAIIARVMSERPRNVTSARPNVPEHVDAAIERALEKIPADRFATAAEFGGALRGSQAVTRSRTARSASASASATAAFARGRLRDPLTLGLLVVAAASVGVAYRATLTRPADNASPGIRKPISIPNASRVAISADGQTVAGIGAGNDGIRQVFVQRLDEDEPRVVPVTVSMAGSPDLFLSPDGSSVVVHSDRELRSVAVGTGASVRLTELGRMQGGTWSPSGKLIISDGTRLLVLPERGGRLEPLTTPDTVRGDYAHHRPVALDDGEHVLFSSRDVSGIPRGLAVVSLKTGAITLLDSVRPANFPLALVDNLLLYAGGGFLSAWQFDLRKRRVIGKSVSVQPSASPAAVAVSGSGTLVTIAPRDQRLVITDTRGMTRALPFESRAYGWPRFSPDGKRIAVAIQSSGTSHIWLFDVGTEASIQLSGKNDINDRPEWTPGGERVLFRTVHNRRSAIAWRPADLSGPETLLLASDSAGYWEAVITPDGRGVVYQRDDGTTGGRADILYRGLLGDTTVRPIATARGLNEESARVSPDGKWVAYHIAELTQVMVVPLDGSARPVVVGRGREPVWSRDPPRLYYRDSTHIVAVRYEALPAFTVLGETRLFEDRFVSASQSHAAYDVSPDGRQFLFVDGVGGSKVVVTHNWIADVRARMAAAMKGSGR